MSQHNQMDRHGRGFRAYCLGFVTEEKDSMIGEDLRIAPAEEKTETATEDSAEGNDEALKVEELLQE